MERRMNKQCTLCKVNSDTSRYSLASKWNKETLAWLKIVSGISLSCQCLICRSCEKYIHRHKGDLSCDRWIKKKTNKPECNVSDCVNHSVCSTQLCSVETAQNILGALNLDNQSDLLNLCNSHYQELYRTLKKPHPCGSCGELPRSGQYFVRKCPNPEAINAYMKEHDGFEGSIKSEDKICKECYVRHKHILSECNSMEISLEVILANFEEKRKNFLKATNLSEVEYFRCIADLIVLNVINIFKSNEAVLLPSLYEKFLSFVNTHKTKLKEEHRGSLQLPQSRWLLTYISNSLGSHMDNVTKHKKYGVLLFKQGGDLLSSLSTALGQSREYQKREANARQECQLSTQMYCNKHDDSNSSMKDITKVCNVINSLIIDEIKRLVQIYSEDVSLYSTFDLRNFAESISPTLKHVINILTQPRKGHKTSTKFDDSKLVKQMYCLMTLFFCTNNQCYMPLHYLLTEAIRCHGGSTVLVKIFNRIGACASIDTLNRIQTKIASERIQRGPSSYLNKNTLSIISVDNIDILQPWAMVSSLHMNRSWHGTSIQGVQPRPTTIAIRTEGDRMECTGQSSLTAIQRKRVHSSSPTCSPAFKQMAKRRRTINKTLTHATQMPTVSSFTRNSVCDSIYNVSDLSINGFKIQTDEELGLDSIRSTVFRYMILKSIINEKQSICSLTNFVMSSQYGYLDSEQSHIEYIDIISLRADSKETMLLVLDKLHSMFIIEQSLSFLIVVGDAKTYDILQQLCKEYGDTLSWVLPFPGDWHTLFNYQKVLVKIYWDAGLLQLAQASGYRAETLTALSCASNFKHTHNFFLQVFEAIFRSFILSFTPTLQNETKELLLHLSTNLELSSNSEKLHNACALVTDTFNNQLTNLEQAFRDHMQQLSENVTCTFWRNFIDNDMLAYFSLFVAIRNSDWTLRNASLKVMVPVFFAFDRPIYQKLLSTHLSDILRYPEDVLDYFERGAFTVHLTARAQHAVALDEAHEMGINKDAKTAVIRPEPVHMQHIANVLPFQSACMKNLKAQINIESTSTPIKGEETAKANISSMMELIKAKKFLQSENSSTLVNSLSNIEATQEQQHDLLKFREIGQTEFEDYIKFRILNFPSIGNKYRKKRLLTFTISKKSREKVKQINREKKIIETCLKKQAMHYRSGGQLSKDIGPPYIPLPRALADKNGLPHKGNKSTVTGVFMKRYEQMQVIITSFPRQWVPDTVLLEGMFIIQTSPVSCTMTFKEYCSFLIQRYIQPHLKANVKDIHVIFDDSNETAESPKSIERRRRDLSQSINKQHKCNQITSTTVVPSDWRGNILNCRTCKLQLCSFLCNEILPTVSPLLNAQQKVYTAGAFQGENKNKCFRITYNGLPTEERALWSNAEETDLRIWLHSQHSSRKRKLLYSKDTDVYHIGLPLPMPSNSDIYIQQTASLHVNSRFVSLSQLLQAIKQDPDLAPIPLEKRPQAIQTLYACTGCDYISFFKGIGKVYFLNVLFQHASFISAGLKDIPGTLGDVDEDNEHLGFLSFVRLVGTSYFKKHLSAFSEEKPDSLYFSITNTNNITEWHKLWLNKIRETVWDRVIEEEYAPPSFEALQLHWKRTVWVLIYWKEATNQHIIMPAMSDYGWQYDENDQLVHNWDTPENISNVTTKVTYLTKGCKCTKGCKARCGCLRDGRNCGPSCRCTDCTNTPFVQEEVDSDIEDLLLDELNELTSINSDSSDTHSDTEDVQLEPSTSLNEHYQQLEHDIDLIMFDIFGDS